MKVEFSARQSLRKAWDNKATMSLVLANFVSFLAMAIIVLPFNFTDNQALQMLGSLVQFVASIVVSCALVRIALNIVDGKEWSEGLKNFDPQVLLHYAITNFVISVVVIIGLIFLIVPGIYLALRFYYALYLVVDKKMECLEALSTSWELTKDNVGHLFLASLLFGLVSCVGLLVCVVGIFFTGALTAVAMVYVYRHFVPAPEASEVAPEVTEVE